MLDPKKQPLNVILTEPVVFLRSSDPSGRHRPDPSDPPTLVRGILVLDVAKPVGISTIEAELTGVLALSPPEAIGSRQVLEKRTIYSSTVTVFRADQVPHGRRAASVGPGLSTINLNNNDERARIASRRQPERRISGSVPPDLGPTPPYTYASPSQIPVMENLAQTLEEPSQALRNGQDRVGVVPRSTPPHSIVFSPPNPTTQFNASYTQFGSFRRDNNDNHTDDAPHTLLRCDSPGRPSRSHSLGNIYGAQPRSHTNTGNSSRTPPGRSGRSRLRLTLGSVLGVVMEVASNVTEERERGRTRVRVVAEEQNRESNLEVGEGVAGGGNASQAGANLSLPRDHMGHRDNHLLGLGRVLGLDREHEKEKDRSKEHGDSWREFKPGKLELLRWRLSSQRSIRPIGSPGIDGTLLQAVAHRPGTFTSKFSCRVPLVIVAAPAVGDGEGSGDPGPLMMQNQWEGQLVYSFALSSRLFLLGSQRHLEAAISEGIRASAESLLEAEVEARAEAAYGTVTLDLTILPIEKIKIWMLSVFVDQCISYANEKGTLFESNKREVKLLEVRDTCSAEEADLMGEEDQTNKNKHTNKDGLIQIPLLPTPISPHRSPLLRYIPPSTDPSILAGPGPYTLSASIGLPGCNDRHGGNCGLHFTVKQRSSIVRIEHTLRITIRAGRASDRGANVDDDGDKGLADICIRTPITILSCRCVPGDQMLPRYSRVTEGGSQNPSECGCEPSVVNPTERSGHGQHDDVENHHIRHVTTSHSTSSYESEDRYGNGNGEGNSNDDGSGHSLYHVRSHEASHALSESSSSTRTSPSWRRHPAHTHTHTHTQTHSHGLHLHPHVPHHTLARRRSHSQTPITTPHSSRSRPPSPPLPPMRYERLVSGLESDAGDAPPAYESIATSGP